MSLSMLDCYPGTVVDHRWERREDGKEVLRETRRRGMIMKVDGEGTDGVTAVYVLFKPGSELEKVDLAELDRVFARSHPKARKIYRELTGQFETIGAEFEERKAPKKPKFEDGLDVAGKTNERIPYPFVMPEGGFSKEDA